MKVESKYKNPDKFIKNLREKLERVLDFQKVLWKRIGKHWFTYQDGVTLNVVFKEEELFNVQKCRIEQEVKLSAKIISIKKNDIGKYVVNYEIKGVNLVDI